MLDEVNHGEMNEKEDWTVEQWAKREMDGWIDG